MVLVKNFRCFHLAVYVILFFQILLSNDKNLCNKAIVNGTRAYKMAEIQQVLQEWGTESSPGNGKVNAGTYILETAYSLGVLMKQKEKKVALCGDHINLCLQTCVSE
jgi:hypothetical protein